MNVSENIFNAKLSYYPLLWKECKMLPHEKQLYRSFLSIDSIGNQFECILYSQKIIKLVSEDQMEELDLSGAILILVRNAFFEPYEITLSRFSSKIILYTVKDDELMSWYAHLKKICIQKDIGDNYTLGDAIGLGGYSRVYSARSRLSPYLCAIKRIEKAKLLKESRTSMRCLVQEIEILKMVQHPNILQLDEIYETKDEVFLVMEHLDGGNLSQKLVKEKLFTERGALRIIYELLLGVSYLHGEGIIHRDLKLENILFLSEKLGSPVKIIDFGLAIKRPDRNHKCVQQCGTPGYVAPEMFGGEGYNEKVDLFSIGVILYILLSGRKPFEGKTIIEVLKNNKENNFSIVGEPWNNVKDTTQELLLHLLKKNPLKRLSAEQALTHSAFNILHCSSLSKICSSPKHKLEKKFV